MLACCILVIDIFSVEALRSDTFRDNVSYLSMASAWFARLLTRSRQDIPFKQIMSLIAMAQQECFG
jgi:hypothetical protein